MLEACNAACIVRGSRNNDERVTVHGRRNNDERVQLKLGEGASIIH